MSGDAEPTAAPVGKGRTDAAALGQPSARFVEAHVGALLLSRECGLVGGVRRWLRRDVIRAVREAGTSNQRASIRGCEEWLAAAEMHEQEHGAGSLVRHDHRFVRLLLSVSRVPGAS